MLLHRPVACQIRSGSLATCSEDGYFQLFLKNYNCVTTIFTFMRLRCSISRAMSRADACSEFPQMERLKRTGNEYANCYLSRRFLFVVCKRRQTRCFHFLPSALSGIMLEFLHSSWVSSLLLLTGVGVGYSLFLVIYRFCLHPLSKFPGPPLAACTYWYEFYHDLIAGPFPGQGAYNIDRLHEQYGL